MVGRGRRSDSEEEAEEDVIKQEITSYRAEPEHTGTTAPYESSTANGITFTRQATWPARLPRMRSASRRGAAPPSVATGRGYDILRTFSRAGAAKE